MSEPGRVEILRGGLVESAHRVHAVVVDGSGNLVRAIGDPSLVTFIRSAAKPFQALPLVTSGAADAYGLDDQELALVCGSHSGEPRHVDVVMRLLAKAEVSPSLLACGTHAPRSKAAKDALRGARATVLHHNCSGKHAGLILLQKHLGADPADYWKPEAPCQKLVLDAISRVAGTADVHLGVDGCSVPSFAMPIRNAALLFARLAMSQGVDAPTSAALARLRDAMTRHPEMVGGGESFDTDLMGASEDRLVSKIGAEACQGIGDLASGLGLFVKVEDGATRALPPASVETLRQLAWLEGRAFEVLGDWWMPTLSNGSGRPVGRVRPSLDLSPTPPEAAADSRPA